MRWIVVLAIVCALGCGASVADPDAGVGPDAARADGGPRADAGAPLDAAAPVDAGAGDDAAGDGAAGDADAAIACTDDEACDDGVFCNGRERCAPGADDADARGCAPPSEARCAVDETCDETLARCLTECDLHADDDADGHGSITCGGDDCDDADPDRFPGHAEICDALGHDEDCDAATYGARDTDGDGHHDPSCCNAASDGAMHCGDDCDDARSAVHPGAIETCDGLDTDCSSGGGAWPAEDADADLHAPIGAACTGGFPADDCLDTNDDVYPGQTAWFTTPIAGVPYAVRFDYDCDRIEELQDTTIASCGAGPTCAATAGWVGSPPPCSSGTAWATRCGWGGSSCYVDPSSYVIRYQGCH